MSARRPGESVLEPVLRPMGEDDGRAPASGGPRLAPAVSGAVLGIATLVAYLPGLGRSLDFDSAETVGLFVKPGPPWSAFQHQAVFNNHPMFSFFEQLVRVVTGRTDAGTMRLLPIACAALAVGVLTWFAARRHGVLAGLTAGLVLACNPTFAGLSRSVRGYSLLTLCAVVSTVLVAEDRPGRSRWYDVGYVLVAGMGLATHLYMVPVVAAQFAAVFARRSLDDRWRRCFLGVLVVAVLAYAGMAQAMVDAAAAHARTFHADMPWQVVTMVTGGGWASVVIAPLVIVGAVLVLRTRGALGAALGLAAVLLVLWAGMQSSALSERFFVWLVPGAGYLAAVAVGRIPIVAIMGAAWTALVVALLLPGYTTPPTNYRESAALLRRVAEAGDRGCVVGVGVPPMLG
ncbi:MAG: glycosyltransferase family 39 protein [Actinomycetota bacterium]|nr:glycosyltransferase family 39 protein [Actinomycetota bacterium]